MPDRLADFPFVTVRLACRRCPRRGQYRLARLAARYGADIGMIDLLEHLAGDCRDWRPRHPFKDRCGAFFVDLDAPPRPPDEPGPGGFRVIPGGRAALGFYERAMQKATAEGRRLSL